MARSSNQAGDDAKPVRVFISYSHKDQKARETLDVHLAQLKREGVQFWFDGDIVPGGEIDANVKREMKLADIFVALASPDYLHSTYCFEKEYSPALRKAARGNIKVVVAILRESQWKHTRMAAYKALPADGKAVERWPRRGEAYEDIVNGLREVIKAVLTERNGSNVVNRSAPAKSTKKSTPTKRATSPPKKAASRKLVTTKKTTGQALCAAKPKPRPKSASKKPTKPRTKVARAPSGRQ